MGAADVRAYALVDLRLERVGVHFWVRMTAEAKPLRKDPHFDEAT